MGGSFRHHGDDFPASNGLVADDGVAVATYIAPDGTVTETMTLETDVDMDLVFSWNPDDLEITSG